MSRETRTHHFLSLIVFGFFLFSVYYYWTDLDRPYPASAATGTVEIHVDTADFPGSDPDQGTTGISDGPGIRDIDSLGTPRDDDYSGAVAFTFDGAGDPTESSEVLAIEDLDLVAHTFVDLENDELSADIVLPFSVDVYATSITRIAISSNGFIYLDGGDGVIDSTDDGCCEGDNMSSAPTLNDDFMVAGVWTDLDTTNGASDPPYDTVRYGTVGTAPTRQFIISFEDVDTSAFGGTMNFQIKLNEGASPPVPLDPTLVSPADGIITSQVPTLSAQYRHGAGTVGVTNYRVSDSSLGDCVAGTNIVASGTSATTATGNEATIFNPSGLSDGVTYFWCAQNDDLTLQSAFVGLAEFELDLGTPTFTYSSYLGGSSFETGDGIAEFDGIAYITGNTNSTDFPSTPGVFDGTMDGAGVGGDAFIAAMQPNGDGLSDLLFSTFVGGSVGESGTGIDVDQGSIFVTGFTSSSDFPTAPGPGATPFDDSKNPGFDGFLAQVNLTGTTLIYGTYIGGSGVEIFYDVDAEGGIAHIAGRTESADFPTTTGAIDETFNAAEDAILTIINPLGGGAADLFYSTVLGGAGDDEAFGIHVDSGLAYLVGETQSAFPTTTGAFQETYTDDEEDAFLSIISPGGAGLADLTYSTLIGSTGFTSEEVATSVDVDGGTVFISGSVFSSSFPTTPGAVDTTKDGFEFDAFLSLISPLGGGATDLIYSTYIDVDGGISVADVMAYDGDAFIVGTASGDDLIVTDDAYQQAHNGSGDVFIQQISPDGSGTDDVLFGTYIGASDFEGANAGVLNFPTMYFTGETITSPYPAFSLVGTAYNESSNGSRDIIFGVYQFDGIDGVCGDAIVSPGEQCDDGNLTDGDSCPSTCVSSIRAIHGGGGSSSPSPSPSPPSPAADPTPEADEPTILCGNGVIENGEECDDGNTSSNDGCSAECAIENLAPPIDLIIHNSLQPTRRHGLILDFEVQGISSGIFSVHKTDDDSDDDDQDDDRDDDDDDNDDNDDKPSLEEMGNKAFIINTPDRIEISRDRIYELLSFNYSKQFYELSQQEEADFSLYNDLFTKAEEESSVPLLLKAEGEDGEVTKDFLLLLDNFPPKVTIDTPAGKYSEPIFIQISADNDI